MSVFKFNNFSCKKIAYYLFICLGFLFFAIESLMPLSSGGFLFKGAYGVEYALNTPSCPKKISFNQDSYTVPTNKSITIALNFEGDEKCSKQIGYEVENSDIAKVYSVSFNEIIVTGYSLGTTSVCVYSCVDKTVKANVDIYVSDGEQLTYDGIASPVFCFAIEDKLTYQNHLTIEYGQNARLNYVVKNKNYTFIQSELTYECEEGYEDTIDKFGNIVPSAKAIGKSYYVKISSPDFKKNYGIEDIQYQIRVNYPSDYGSKYVSSLLSVFIVYILTFVFFGLFASFFGNYIAFSNKKKMLIIILLATVFISIAVIMLQAFVLSRKFNWIYWLVSPIIAGISYLLGINDARSKLFRSLKEVFYE